MQTPVLTLTFQECTVRYGLSPAAVRDFVQAGLLRPATAPDAVLIDEPDDLTQDVPVSIYKALLGGEQTVDTLGGPVKIKLKPETANGTRLRLRGKGFPVFRQPGEFGDLYLRLTLTLPQNLTDAEKALVQQLAVLRPDA